MGLNLEPYNYWILYAALALFLICVIIAGIKAGGLLKAIRSQKPAADSIQKNVELAKIKVEAMKEKKSEDAEKNKKYRLLIPILLAIKHTYDNDENLNGVKGMAKATNQVLQKRTEQKKLFESIIK